jgi:hypothetical protein
MFEPPMIRLSVLCLTDMVSMQVMPVRVSSSNHREFNPFLLSANRCCGLRNARKVLAFGCIIVD